MRDPILWSQLREQLESAPADPLAALLAIPCTETEERAPASTFLLRIVTERDEEELRFLHAPEIRHACLRLMHEHRIWKGVPELTFYLRDHWFYEGETEEISQEAEKLHLLAIRPYLGMETPEMLQTIQKDLYGHCSKPEEDMVPGELRAVRLVAWATRDQVPLTCPDSLKTLGDLAKEIFDLSI
jgi:hypothetical protein